MPIVYLGLGSNLGDRFANLRGALGEIARIADIEACSRVYETEPVHVVDQPAFLNMAVRVRTSLEPADLLRAVKAIETRLGRTETVRFGPRVIDIDILLADGVVLRERELEIPHPRLAERRFALAPLADVGASAPHPVAQRTVAELLAALPPAEAVHVVADGLGEAS